MNYSQLGYVDEISLYGGYFAEHLGLDPEGLTAGCATMLMTSASVGPPGWILIGTVVIASATYYIFSRCGSTTTTIPTVNFIDSGVYPDDFNVKSREKKRYRISGFVYVVCKKRGCGHPSHCPDRIFGIGPNCPYAQGQALSFVAGLGCYNPSEGMDYGHCKCYRF